MKRIAVFALVLVFGLLSTATTILAASKKSVMVTHKEAKVRNGPATTYKILWRPRMYTPFEIMANFKDVKGQKWFIVRDHEGDIGWIHNSVVSEKVGAIVTVKIADVSKRADSKSQALFQAPKNYTFKVLKEQKGWYKVQDPEGDKGWIKSKNVWTGRSAKPKKGQKHS